MKYCELDLLLRLAYPVRAQHTLVDVGAHVGGFSRPFAKKGWRVIAFEPEQKNLQELRANLKGFTNVWCVAKAVSETCKQGIPFYLSRDHWGIHSLRPFHPTHDTTVSVDTVRLDETLSDLGINQVTVLKIDIEGADFLALKGFDFGRFQPEVVMCEFMDERSQANFGYSYHDMAGYMATVNYVTFVSEWAAIVEYGRKGVPISHTFLQCRPYPLDHDPAWGNLIFVPRARATEFEHSLTAYLGDLGQSDGTEALRSLFRTLPGVRVVYRVLRRMHQTLSLSSRS